MKALVTGGAGFIGSNLVDRLLEYGNDVVVIDSLISGSLDNLKQHKNNKKLKIIVGDILDKKRLEESLEGVDTVYHLAANPDVKIGAKNPDTHFEQGILTTYRLLEAMRKNNIKNILFTSSSVVYGDAKKVPTPEDYAIEPISVYGGAKVAAEALIMSYCHTFGMNAKIFRFANVIGRRSNHGVIFDFMKRLKDDSSKLDILGDGTQCKSYIYIDDCIEGILYNKSFKGLEVYNLGSDDKINVKEIAASVVRAMGLKNIKYNFVITDDGRGWKGDVRFMQLSIDKIKKLGWKPKYNSQESIEKAIKDNL